MEGWTLPLRHGGHRGGRPTPALHRSRAVRCGEVTSVGMHGLQPTGRATRSEPSGESSASGRPRRRRIRGATLEQPSKVRRMQSTPRKRALALSRHRRTAASAENLLPMARRAAAVDARHGGNHPKAEETTRTLGRLGQFARGSRVPSPLQSTSKVTEVQNPGWNLARDLRNLCWSRMRRQGGVGGHESRGGPHPTITGDGYRGARSAASLQRR